MKTINNNLKSNGGTTMAGFDELKQKAKDAAEAIADKSVEIAKAAGEKTRTIAKSAKLNAEISKEKSNLKRYYAELGSIYYTFFKDSPDEHLEQICEEITNSLELIDAKQAELSALKDDPDVEVEIIQEEPCDEEPCKCCCDAEDAPAEEPVQEDQKAE